MVRRWVVILVLAASVATVLLLLNRQAPAPKAPVPLASAAGRTVPEPIETPRLRPDSRFLSAVGDVHALLRHAPGVEATAAFEDGRWRVSYRGETVGSLPEIPDFADLRALLTDWAVRLGARDSLSSPPAIAPYDDVETALRELKALRAADLADRRWLAGDHSPDLFRLAARAQTLLAAESVDAVSAADRVAARALALTAIACALDSTSARSEECSIALSMGYPAEASGLAAALPADDPIRAYARREDRRLEQWPRTGARKNEAHLYALLRCAARRDLEGWEAMLGDAILRDSTIALPVLATGLGLGRFESNEIGAAMVLAAVAVDLRLNEVIKPRDAAVREVRPLESLTSDFESMMNSMPAGADGPLLDREFLRSYYRGCFYTSLYNIGDHLRTRLSSLPATRAFSDALGDGAGRQGPDAEFQRWFAHLADAKRGKADLAALRSDLTGLPHFGAELPLATYEAIRLSTPQSDPLLRRCAMELGTRLDTRPSNLLAYAPIVHRDMLHLTRAEQLYAHGVAASHPLDVAQRSWWAAFTGDRPRLRELLEAPDLAPELRIAALRNLSRAPVVDTIAIRDAYRRCIAEKPDDWDVIRGYVHRLEAWRDWRESEQVCREWLSRPEKSDRAFDEIEARTSLARALKLQGRYAEGFNAIAPVVGSWQGDALAQAVDLLWYTGRAAEAETLAVAAWGRYPDNPYSHAKAVGMFWRTHEYQQAAKALLRFPRAIKRESWHFDIGPYFVACFARDTAAGTRALDALEAAGFKSGENVGLLAAALADSGYAERAFETASRVRDQGQAALLQQVYCYRYLRTARGSDEARAWIRSHAGRDAATLSLLAYIGFSLDCDELLWDLDYPEMRPREADFLWLLRAAACVRDSAAAGAHRGELDQYFAAAGDSHYRILGRYLLGHENEDAVLATGTVPDAKCENAFYLGLRAESEGDYAKAADWYLACVRTDQRREGEFSWSYQRLAAWSARWNSLEQLARADGRSPRAAKLPPS